tara:strand:- start:5507 stop:7258 length:1752 start_codon:yes stop_codon:yes gene_type:complete
MSGTIADMLDYSLKEVPQQSEIRTETIEPNNATTDTTRVFKYTIRNVGFLEGTSMLTFKLKRLSGTNGNLRINMWNGALGCIKNAVLKVGDFEINNCQDVDRIATLMNLNQSVLQRRNVMGHYLGNSMELEVNEDGAVAAHTVAPNGTPSVQGQILLDETHSGVNFGTNTDGTGKVINSLSINSDTTLNEKFGIPLNMIFPCLKGRSLPLFLFTDYNIQLEFEMNFADRFAYNLGKTFDGGHTHADYMALSDNVGFAEVELVVDYLLPPSSVINNYIEQTSSSGGYRFEFPQIAVVKKKLPAVSTSKELQEVEHRLGQTGKEVHNIIQMKRFSDFKDKNGSSIALTSATTTNASSTLTAVSNIDNISANAKITGTNIQANTFVKSVQVVAGDNQITLMSSTGAARNASGGGAQTDVVIVNPSAHGLNRRILQGQSIDGVDEEEYNVEVNGLDVFPQFIYNNASQYDKMSNVLDGDMIVPRPMYFTDPNSVQQRLAPITEGLIANYKPLGVDLRNGNDAIVGGGTVINSGSPLIFKYKRKPKSNSYQGNDIDMRKEMDVDYYITHARVVVVKKLPKATQVMVSS